MRLTLVTRLLIGFLAVLAAYFFLYEQKHRAADREKRMAERKLFPFAPESVRRFILVNPDGERIDIERRDDGWMITAPTETPGDGPAIDVLLRQIAPGRRTEEIANVTDFASYGLAQPYATVILFTGIGSPDTLSIGDKTPTSSNTYVRLGHSRSVLISAETTRNVVHKSLYHLRDKTFLPFTNESIDGVNVRSGDSALELRRIGAYWWLAHPRVRVDRSKIERYLTALTTTIIRGFPREDVADLAPYGLRRPDRQIVLARGSDTTTVSFGRSEEDQVYAIRSGLAKVTLLEGKLLGAFDWTAAGLRAMNLAFFAPDSVSVIRYDTPDSSVVLHRAGATWTEANGDTIPSAKAYLVTALLRRLTTTSFDEIVAESVRPEDRRLANWAIKLSLEDIRGGVIDRITIAEISDTTQVGTSLSAGALGTLKTGSLREIRSSFARIDPR